MSMLTHLECSKCGEPLFARYDLEAAKETLTERELVGRVSSMWRYREILPVRRPENIVTLGEGWIPLTPTPRLGEILGLRNLLRACRRCHNLSPEEDSRGRGGRQRRTRCALQHGARSPIADPKKPFDYASLR